MVRAYVASSRPSAVTENMNNIEPPINSGTDPAPELKWGR